MKQPHPFEWSISSLANINHFSPASMQPKNHIGETFELFSVPIFPERKPEVVEAAAIGSSKQRVQADDILVSKINPRINRVWKVSESQGYDQIASSEWIPVRSPHMDAQFLTWYFRSQDFRTRLCADVTGVGGSLTRAQPKKVATFEVPIPPFAEQKIIADKLDLLLEQVTTTKSRLERTLETLKQFRQSVLADAVSGKLTADWRKNNLTSERWEDISFHELILKVRSGSADKPTDDVNGVPILRSSAVRPLSVDYSDVRYLNDVDNLKNENYLRNGDLLFTRLSGSAEYVGNCALVKGVENEYQYPDRLFCARLKDPTHAEYLEYFCNSDGFRQHIYSSIKSSAGHQRITLDVIKKAPISLPPRAEQEEIVTRIKKLFAGADVTEQQVNQALERVNNLTQSILAKAFRGELTEQWREENPELISGDNSADKLLEKIKAERALTKPKRKTRKKAG